MNDRHSLQDQGHKATHIGCRRVVKTLEHPSFLIKCLRVAVVEIATDKGKGRRFSGGAGEGRCCLSQVHHRLKVRQDDELECSGTAVRRKGRKRRIRRAELRHAIYHRIEIIGLFCGQTCQRDDFRKVTVTRGLESARFLETRSDLDRFHTGVKRWSARLFAGTHLRSMPSHLRQRVRVLATVQGRGPPLRSGRG